MPAFIMVVLFLKSMPGKKRNSSNHITGIICFKYNNADMKDKIVVIGAGKIGRSFIGQVFSRSGYEVVFVDINKRLIESINEQKEYRVVIKGGDKEDALLIQNVRGLRLDEEEKIVTELTDSALVSLSVGRQGLQAAIPVIAGALVARRERYGDIPLDIIIAENMRNADMFIRSELERYLPQDYPSQQLVGLVETSIGKMVPVMTKKDMEDDPLQVFAEPYNSLIVAKNGFKNPIPNIPFLAPKENIKAWVDRKLFIHNLGHATVAYLGYKTHPEAIYIYEVLDDEELRRCVRQTMLQAADILQALYPGEFSHEQLEEHITDLINRFGNRSLGDTIFRVGCDLYRKLGPEDRLAAPVRAAIRLGKPYNLILDSIKAGITFRARDENGNYLPSDERFFEESKKGEQYILENVCQLRIENYETTFGVAN
jgi:mannitol-1-phosphate 5-dehydrogenase